MPSRLTATTVATAIPVRSSVELAISARAIAGLVASDDAICRLLGLGARRAAERLTPTLVEHIGGCPVGPNSPDVPSTIKATGGTAAGLTPWRYFVHDAEGQIMALGAEEWLTWAFLPGYPLPLWLVPGMPASEIHRGIRGQDSVGVLQVHHA